MRLVLWLTLGAGCTQGLSLPAAPARLLAARPALPRAAPPICVSEEESQARAERDETIEYVKTLGLFSGGSLGMFFALSAGGLDDQQAGNVVLLALVGFGAYLLFFDGGVTQAALERQAVQQAAVEEGDIMAAAPRAEVHPAPDAAAAVVTVARDGFARVNEVLSPGAASALLAHVNAEFQAKAAEAAEVETGIPTKNFGDVLMRDNRYDLLLDLDPPVRDALREVLGAVKPVMAGVLGEDAELFELAALISDPRSPRQPVHPDTPHREGSGVAVLTTFVALQDVEENMGPTVIIPQTQTAEAHARFNSRDDGGRAKLALLRQQPNHLGVLRTGDANLIDSRVIHAGGGNDSERRRVLFYMSFRAKGARTPTGSLKYDLRRAGHRLDGAEGWAAA